MASPLAIPTVPIGARRRRARTRRLAALAGLGLVVATTATACEIETDVPMTCFFLGSLTPKAHSNSTPDAVAPGAAVTNIVTIIPPPVNVSLPVDRAVFTTPLADEMTVEDITFGPGPWQGSFQVDGHTLTVALDIQGVTTDHLTFPAMTMTARVSRDAAPGTVPWFGPGKMDITIGGMGITETCNATGSVTINNTEIAGAPIPTTTLAPGQTTTTTVRRTTSPAPTTTTTLPPPPPPPLPEGYDVVLPLQCQILGATTLFAKVNSPGLVTTGGPGRLELDMIHYPPTNISAPLDYTEVSFPVPAGVASITGVTFSGVEVSPTSWAVADGRLLVRFTQPGVTFDRATIPHLSIAYTTVSAGSPIVIEWAAPSVGYGVLGIVESCPPVAGAPLLARVAVAGPV